jgi:glyoxalase family protein
MTHGIHHITMICGDAQENLDFYVGLLGMRLVKLTVNFDDPTAYHFYYGDATGSPGSALTFFPYPDGRSALIGNAMVSELGLSVPVGSLAYWQDRLASAGVQILFEQDRFGADSIAFSDRDGLPLRLIESGEPGQAWPEMTVPVEYAITKSQRATIMAGTSHVRGGETATGQLMKDMLGWESIQTNGNVSRYGTPDGSILDIINEPNQAWGRGGHGGVHHIAFRIDSHEHQIELMHRLEAKGHRTSGEVDRTYFRSIYFREPGGVLFEVATDEPGMMIDETFESLGRSLRLPPQYEGRRDLIERALPKLVRPEAGAAR